ncbi:uncharacterized protein ATNIH1004_010101 [Aspergillus tanneri]|uniref:Uncharacterized protein n=1 Tax=Aspergillus tanneri TaxID=1220188 RepID=A0A5M9MDH3_9EURO|nr:uncharacterized protein ATNIH1004_010101 [Aspergillus tanneri]KAA8643334.1 hypothetical protein ATNIH1004_010101 [Aspergillus tanneri]
MVMSMVLATAASEFHRSRLLSEHVSVDDLSDVEGRSHYGKALSGLREVLKQEVKSPEQIEAIFITLWLMGDYENRFGSGSAGINVHIKGITSLLFNHIMPLLKPRQQGPPPAISMGESSAKDHPTEGLESQPATSATEKPDGKLRYTSVPLFLLWTLYLFNPGTIFYGPGCANANIGLLRLFLCAEPGGTNLSLPELYRISRQSPSHFWGDGYPATAHLDDLENLPGLGLYHRSHVTQFRITELYRQHSFSDVGVQSPFQQIVDEISAIAKEFDILLSFAKAAPSYEIAGEGRRVMETVYWSSMNYYSTIVYFHLCFMDVLKEQPQCLPPQILSLDEAASLVLELALKLHRSRPRAMIRTFWPLFIAGIATRDQIYKDWVSTRLRELTRYGQNYGRVSDRFDEITQGHDSFAYARKYLSTLHQN